MPPTSLDPSLPSIPLPPAGSRVLLFAPHPDDETLAAGGLLHQAMHAGATVRVVYLTDGDAFRLAALRGTGAWPGPKGMQILGALRRGEALAALRALGVPAETAAFLGYPDRGLASLWMDRWHTPLVSRYTRRTATPEGSWRPGAPYTGVSLLEDLEAILHRERPNFVYLPHPADDHPDHWAAACFIRLALARVRREAQPVVRAYLVHRGHWPPTRSRELRLVPPPELRVLGGDWESLELSDDALSAKTAALAAHRTQLPLVGGFLRRFLRRNELFHALPESPKLAPGKSLTHADPARDRLSRACLSSGDIAAVELERQETGFHLRMRLRGRIARGLEYRLLWKAVEGPVHRLATHAARYGGGRAATLEADGTALSTRFERESLPGSGVMVGAEVWAGPLLLDRTPWHFVELEPAPGDLPVDTPEMRG